MAGIQLAPFVLAILVVLGNAADTVDSTDNKAPGYFGDDRDDLNGASFFFLLLIALGPIVIMWCIWKVKRVRSERWRNLYVNDQAEIRRRATEQLVVARHAQDLRDRERQRQNGGDENTGSGVGIPFEWYHDQELRMHSHVVDCLFPEHKVRFLSLAHVSFVVLNMFASSVYSYVPHSRARVKEEWKVRQATPSVVGMMKLRGSNLNWEPRKIAALTFSVRKLP
jgi:hypothetical protein